MADSMMMSRDEIAAADAELDPGRDAGKSEAKAPEKGKEQEPEIEYVGPDADGDGDGKAKAEAEGKDKPEAKAAEKPGDKGKKDEKPKPPEGFVDRNALVAEREARKREADQHAAYRRQTEEKLNILLGQIAQINQQAQQASQPKAEDKAPLRWEDDPAAFTQQNLAELRKQNEELRNYLAGQHQQSQQQTQQQHAVQYYTNAITVSEQQVSREQPDYYPAVNALRAARAAELAEMPQFRGNPQAVEAQLQREALHLAEQAVRNGEPPAAVYYRLAVARGWRPEMAQQQPPAQQRQAAQLEVKNNEAAAEIEQLAKAKEASEGLSNSGGSAPSANRMSLESFDRMSNKEIAAWIARETKKNGPGAVDAALAKMMGAAR